MRWLTKLSLKFLGRLCRQFQVFVTHLFPVNGSQCVRDGSKIFDLICLGY